MAPIMRSPCPRAKALCIPPLATRLLSLAVFSSLACGPDDPIAAQSSDGRTLRTTRDRFGLLTCGPKTEIETCFTHRTLMGASMGAGGAGALGLGRPELFDTVGMLGVSTVDWVYFLRLLQRSWLGGFCDRESILANIDALDDPATAPFCGPVPGTVHLTPDRRIVEAAQDFNHWHRGVDAGRGGAFGRNLLRASFQDIALAYGNPTLYNPASPYYPPGVPSGFRGLTDAQKCSPPPSIPGIRHREYNPDGAYDMVVLCDTWTDGGDFDPARPSEGSMEIALAVDYNANGIRDYAEPVVLMMHERFNDVGLGDPTAYHWLDNPAGTAGNWRYDEGEPYDDDGLDGVAGTGDFGEGNGRFDYSPNVLNYLSQNPRHHIETMDRGQLDRLNIYADAGIRDFLMSAAATNWLWGSLMARVGAEQARHYTTFEALAPDDSRFDALEVDYRPSAIGQHVYVRYGNPDATAPQIDAGDGQHVGPVGQLLQRLLTALTFVQARFDTPDYTAYEGLGGSAPVVEPGLFAPPALDGETREFGIVLPPGYHDPVNAEQRYPVVYFLHGQSMNADSLLTFAILFYAYMASSADPEQQRLHRSDWAKFILVFPDSTCGNEACTTGNFNANHRGVDGDGPRYADALYELMAYVEREYRVAIPVEVENE